MEIIFGGGMYFDKNTYQFESVEFVRQKRTNYARVKLQTFGGKARKGVSDSLKHPGKPALSGMLHFLKFSQDSLPFSQNREII